MNTEVLICSYNEAAYIPSVLESLRAQTVGANNFRVIFIDNASSDDTSKVVRENSYGLNLDAYGEERKGLNWARNQGYAHAKAEYVAHIDADAKADPRWLENIERVIQQKHPDVCGGPYFPYYISAKPKWFLDRYNSSYMDSQARFLREREYLSGTNMVWKRNLVQELGGFDGNVGLSARGLARGDEVNLFNRAQKQIPDFKAYYDPQILVYHLTRVDTYSLLYWVRRHYALGLHSHLIWENTEAPLGRVKALVHLLGRLVTIMWKGIRTFIHRDRAAYPYWQNYWYEQLSYQFYLLGLQWSIIWRKPPNRATITRGTEPSPDTLKH